MASRTRQPPGCTRSPIRTSTSSSRPARKLGGPQQRGGLVASLQNLIAPPKTALDPRVGQMKHELSSTLDSLGKVYADGWVTEFEVGALMHARDRLAAVLRLAEPDVLMMLPKDVRQRLEAQLFAPCRCSTPPPSAAALASGATSRRAIGARSKRSSPRHWSTAAST